MNAIKDIIRDYIRVDATTRWGLWAMILFALVAGIGLLVIGRGA